MMNNPPPQASIVFIDDAHTFGGTQVAMAWSIHTILAFTEFPVLCVCTDKTRRAVEEVNGAHSRLSFLPAPSALPLNVLSFPVRLPAYLRLLRDIRRRPVHAWWLNLADIEFCIAPLLVLRTLGLKPRSYLHGTARFTSFFKRASWQRRALSWFRDLVADTFVYRLHSLIVAPSVASQMEVKARLGGSSRPPVGYLYYPPIGQQAQLIAKPVVLPRAADDRQIKLWMIGGVAFGHKNNLAALDVLELLRAQGYDATLTVAGTGTDLQRFQDEASRRQLAALITYLGWVSDPCDTAPRDAIVLIPSFHETMNIVAREAMRNGLRIVVSPIPVFHEWIPASLIAENFTREAFCAKVTEVCRADPTLIGTSYAAALARFSNDIFIQGFLRFTEMDTLQMSPAGPNQPTSE